MPVEAPAPNTTMVYVPVCGSTTSWAGKPLSKYCVLIGVPEGPRSCHCMVQHATDPESLKETVWPTAPLNVYASTDPAASMFPAPAPGTPFETAPPNAMVNTSCVGTEVSEKA